MKFVKCISLFFALPLCLIGLGFCLGSGVFDFFYPGGIDRSNITKEIKTTGEKEIADGEVTKVQFRAASVDGEQVIDADTRFFVEETDLRRDTCVETEWELPDKYIGMNREEFLIAMEEYELSPPLSEMERGFVSLEVKSFSGEKVLIRMNYVYTAPTTSFYIMAEKHNIVVYCDDKKTLYMKTNIQLNSLPDELQQKIIAGMFVEDEKTLYYFLESYSS